MLQSTQRKTKKSYHRITQKDLPLCCPLPNRRLWDAHPRVYLPISEPNNRIACPYCGTEYRMINPIEFNLSSGIVTN